MSIPNDDANPETVPDKDAAADVYTGPNGYRYVRTYVNQYPVTNGITNTYPNVYAGPYSDTGEYDDDDTDEHVIPDINDCLNAGAYNHSYCYTDAAGTRHTVVCSNSHRNVIDCTRSDCESDRRDTGECHCSTCG